MKGLLKYAVEFNKLNMTREDLMFLQEMGLPVLEPLKNKVADLVLHLKTKSGKKKTVTVDDEEEVRLGLLVK